MNKTPNILLIMVDQQRYDCIGFSNDYPVQTPHIDQLAAEGIWFSNAYSHIPLCSPARQSLVNGRRAESFGGLWNYDNGLKVSSLPQTEYSWARELKKLNYNRGYIGKWGVNPNHDPLEYGYDRYVKSEELYERFKLEKYPHVQYTKSYMGENDPIPLADSKTHWTASQAIAMIKELSSEDNPWHIRINFSEPHLPCRPAEPFSQMYAPDSIPMWRSFKESFANKPYIQKQQLLNWEIQDYTWEDWAPIASRYYGIISQLDDAIGKVMTALEQLEIADETMVIFTSDHGDMCGGHRMMDKHYILYDDVIKVPLAIRWPDGIKPGQKCSRFVYNLLDLPPTLLDVLGLDIPEFFHGRSFKALLSPEFVEPDERMEWRDAVVATYNGQQFGLYTQRMIRNERWKYIWNTTDVDELYDLREDADELHNLIHDTAYASLLKQLREQLYHVLLHDGDGLVQNSWMRNQLLKGHKL